MIIKSQQSWDHCYGELIDDVDFVEKCENVQEQLLNVQGVINKLLLLRAHYEELPVDHKIELDLLLVYMLNSLNWMNLRLQGVDMSKHPIKNEFDRIKAAMLRWKEVKERNKRPKVNIAAANRFVRNGLYDHEQNNKDKPPNKKIKFDD